MQPIPEDPQHVRPLLVNMSIPSLTLTGTDGLPYDVNASVHEKPTIILFYRGGW